ncbi:MAG: nucleotide exchange factor GrpE [Eubacteriales bacterium]|nr:nucleotide exchange factor GrpE [Eubacteriales bacterium]
MSEQEKKNQQENAEEVVEEVAAEAAENKEEETFTVSREQMEKMEQLAKLVSDSNDKYLRLAAEYDNYRKRTTREKENIYGDAKADTVKPFLEVYDNLVRGVQQFPEGDGHRQGLEMIAKQFLDVLQKLGVTEIEAEGQPFDPEKHNAVMHVDDENVGENTVVEVFQKGFMLGEKVLRFAMVKVAN